MKTKMQVQELIQFQCHFMALLCWNISGVDSLVNVIYRYTCVFLKEEWEEEKRGGKNGR